MEVLKMEEPISRKLTNVNNSKNNSRSLNSSFKGNSSDVHNTELDKLRKKLILTQSENLTLQRELSASISEEAEHKEKIVELTRRLKEIEKKNEGLVSSPKSPKQTHGVSPEDKMLTLRNKNKDLEKKIEELQAIIGENEGKDETIEKQRKRMNDLEEKLSKYEENKIGDGDFNQKEKEYQEIMQQYEALLKKVNTEQQNLIHEKNTVQTHLANLESAFNDLLEKYERAKMVVEGFKSNEDVLKKKTEDLTNMLLNFDKKYAALKAYAEEKLSQANVAIMNQNKGNIEEVAKLKAKLLQSQVKIKELEKHVKSNNQPESVSLFAPLKNDLKKKR